MADFSEYIIYVDESGDHSLTSIDMQFPVFVLAFCIFKKADYANVVLPALQALKFDHFGHDMVILHEREIRKQIGSFAFLADKGKRESFHADLNRLVADAQFTLVAVAIHKQRLAERYVYPGEPYEMAVTYGLERIRKFLLARGELARTVHVVFESRGKKEDMGLELAFRRVCDGANYRQELFPFQIVFASKKTNSGGLQLADLVARPIGRYVINADQPNRAYEILKEKFYRSSTGVVNGFGLKTFP